MSCVVLCVSTRIDGESYSLVIEFRTRDQRDLVGSGIFGRSRQLNLKSLIPSAPYSQDVFMNVLLIIGRVLFAFIFLVSGWAHVTKAKHMVGYAQAKKVPAPKLSIQISGLLLFLGALSIIFGVYADLGALVIAVLLALFAVKMHDFWTQTDAQQKQNEMTQFLKDISMAGAALVLFVVIGSAATGSDVIGPMITDALFSL